MNSKKIKILLLWPYFYPQTFGVACANRGQAFVKYFKKKGVDVHVIAPEKKDAKEIIEYESCIVERIKTYNTVGESYPFFVSLLYLPVSVVRLIWKIKKIKPDLIMASTPGPFMPFEGLIVAKYLKIPFIFDMQDSWHLSRFSHTGAIRNTIKMYLEGLCAIHANIVFSVTPTYRKTISTGYNIPIKKIELVYNGVDFKAFPKEEKIEIIDLIHLGSPRGYYDTLRLIEAFSIIVRSLPKIRIKFLGCTDEDYVYKIRKFAEEKGVSKNIEFASHMPYENVPYELNKAKIGIISLIDLPEYKSAVGVKVLEYMAAGLPTAYLGPSESEQEQLIKENDVGICATEPDEFAKKVINLLNNIEMRRKMSINARKSIKKYNWEEIINQVFESSIQPLIMRSDKD